VHTVPDWLFEQMRTNLSTRVVIKGGKAIAFRPSGERTLTNSSIHPWNAHTVRARQLLSSSNQPVDRNLQRCRTTQAGRLATSAP
jgi:hypothetical protein